MNISGIPEFVRFDDLADALAPLGFDLRGGDYRSIHIGWNSIVVELLAKTPKGQVYAAEDSVAVHKLTIPMPMKPGWTTETLGEHGRPDAGAS